MSVPQICNVYGGVAVPGVLIGPSAFVSAPHISNAGEMNPWVDGLGYADKYTVSLSDSLSLSLIEIRHQLRAPLFEEIGTSSAAAPFRAIQERLPAVLMDFATLYNRSPDRRKFVQNRLPLEQMELDIKEHDAFLQFSKLFFGRDTDHKLEQLKRLSGTLELAKRLMASQHESFVQLLDYFQGVREKVFDHGRWYSSQTPGSVMAVVPTEVALVHYLEYIKRLERIDELTSESVDSFLSIEEEFKLAGLESAFFDAKRLEEPPEEVLNSIRDGFERIMDKVVASERDNEDMSGFSSKQLIMEDEIEIEILKLLSPMLRRLEGYC